MSAEERNAWVLGVIAVLGYAVYLVIIFTRAQSVPLAEVAWVDAMIWTIGGAIVAGIILAITVTIVFKSMSERADQRDRQIYQFGERVGQSFLVIGGTGALILLMIGAAPFWIANLIYLCFVLSGILSALAQIIAYRRGLPQW